MTHEGILSMKPIDYSSNFKRALSLSILIFVGAFPACEQKSVSAPPTQSASELRQELNVPSPEPFYTPAGREYRMRDKRSEDEKSRELEMLQERHAAEMRLLLERSQSNRAAPSKPVTRAQSPPAQYYSRPRSYSTEPKRETPKPGPAYTPAGREFNAPMLPPPSGPVNAPTPY